MYLANRLFLKSPAVSLALLLTAHSNTIGATLKVGPGAAFTKPSEACAAAKDGDVVEIVAGTYSGDECVWRANSLTIRGVGGMAHVDDAGTVLRNQKAIWVIHGDNTTIEHVEFSGASVPDKNGAGIRQEGAGLVLRHCTFHDNEDGILAGASDSSDIDIEESEFNHNGAGDGPSHNIYIGKVRSFTMRGCWSHDAFIGHNVKSRALQNIIEYNFISDGDTGRSSYDIDLPNGGSCYVLGNVIQHGPKAENGVQLSFGEEGMTNPKQALYVVNNTFVNDRRPGGSAIRAPLGFSTAIIENNLFMFSMLVSKSPWALTGKVGDHNLLRDDTRENVEGYKDRFFVPAADDFHLNSVSPAIAHGVAVPSADGISLTPTFEYVRDGIGPRPVRDPIDVGAYAYRP